MKAGDRGYPQHSNKSNRGACFRIHSVSVPKTSLCCSNHIHVLPLLRLDSHLLHSVDVVAFDTRVLVGFYPRSVSSRYLAAGTSSHIKSPGSPREPVRQSSAPFTKGGPQCLDSHAHSVLRLPSTTSLPSRTKISLT